MAQLPKLVAWLCHYYAIPQSLSVLTRFVSSEWSLENGHTDMSRDFILPTVMFGVCVANSLRVLFEAP